MSHIALMSVPLHGHLNPMLGLAAELVRRGHRVTFATGDDFAPLVEETGATPLGYTTTFPSTSAPGRGWLPVDDEGGQLAVDAFRTERDAVLPQVAAYYAEDRPDLVVYDTVTGHAPVLARAWDVPEVQFSPSQALPTGARTSGGKPGHGAGEVPCVVALPRCLQYQADQVGGHHVFVGPIAWQRSGQGSWTPPADGRPVAYVSLGTTYNTRTELFGWAAGAFTGLRDDWDVVVATGHGTDPGALNELPPHVEVHRWVPQQNVLARASLFVSAGGTGSVLEALTLGVPLVVLPQAHEQFVTAHQIAALGVGAVVQPGQVDAASLQEAVRRVTSDPGVEGRLAAVREEISRSGGARAAADVVEARLPRTAAGAVGVASQRTGNEERS